MIRHIVLIQLNESATPEVLDQIHDELAALDFPGRISFTMGVDLGLREGNLDAALVADFTDAAAYRTYDVDPEHVRIRRDLIAPIAERLERCQYEI